jgi:hypothetical protein
MPSETISPMTGSTMGMVLVARMSAESALVPKATIKSTLRPVSSAASSGSRSYFPSAVRISMTMFLPST